MEPWLRAIILAAIFGAVLILVERLVSAISRSRSSGSAINKRLQMIEGGHTREETMVALRRDDDAASIRFGGFIGRIGESLRTLLVQAGVTGNSGQIAIMLMSLPFVVFLALLAIFSVGGYAMNVGRVMLLAAVALGLGAAIPFLILRFMANRRRKKMGEQFPVALDVFVRGLRAGHPVAAALDLLTAEMPDPVGSEFGLVIDEVTYGADLRDALDEMAERWDLDDIRMFVVSLSVQQETGGNLAEILDNLTKVIRDRQAMVMKVRALSSEGRMTAWMLSSLPLLTLLIVFMGNSSFFLDVAEDPIFVPAFAILILMWLIGVFMIRKLVDLKV
ncbi:type II secretion system F family protein [Sphingomicrobium sp. B8]|uniref:Type II secretion system F family protein n=1 Tax=Sphingomicrobium clamense TaxID=2851013 RepID=A0ABS6V3E3_9SPHN|nr:type II secretion system F family protein [Sphingomicrobium sp. B8]